jgi:16S rRNA (cytidine1402-2'-O)-methyltransferase
MATFQIVSGTLYVVPTPLGNLEDNTLRASRTLKTADVILAEDTRTTSVLLRHLGIDTPMRSYHQHNEHRVLDDMIAMLQRGSQVALVSDAGTPGISDPGYLLVREAVRREIQVITLPGPTAFVPALVNSGLPCQEFSFYGFLPQKKGRRTRLQQLASEHKTFVLYESPFRLVKLLDELAGVLGGERPASVSREISKLFEETRRGSLHELHNHFTTAGVKGEIVVVVAGTGHKNASHPDE